jgi:hypothetical protein
MSTRPNRRLEPTSDVGILIARAQARETDPRRSRPRPGRVDLTAVRQRLADLEARYPTRADPADLEQLRQRLVELEAR